MIQYLKRYEIDEIKYNDCIKFSQNARIYAYSWYLDCVADNWDALVLNDYEAVMPLSWREKYFIKYIYPPVWTQQLGVFSKFKIEATLIKEFINAIPKKFKKITIQFNAENDLSLFKTEKRLNYILPLNKSCEENLKGFNNNRRRDVKKAEALNNCIDKEIDKNEFLEFYLSSDKNYELNLNQFSKLKSLILNKNEAINIWGIRKNNILISCLLFLKDSKRITYLLPVSTNEAKENGFPTLLIFELIREFSKSGFILDFEGSMIKGVAEFYKSFGAIKEDYFLYQKQFYLY